MTQAIPDKIDFMGDSFVLCPVFSYKDGGEILVGEDIGLERGGYSSACRSGFVSHYSIDETKQLSLNSLSLIGASATCRNVYGSEIMVEAAMKKVKGINYFPLFTGSLLLLKDYSEGSTSIYRCPDDYETVIKLKFIKGRVVELTTIRVKDRLLGK